MRLIQSASSTRSKTCRSTAPWRASYCIQAVPGVAVVPLTRVVTYDDWRAACPEHPKGLFDRLAESVLGDPETWGVEMIAPGVFGPIAKESA